MQLNLIFKFNCQGPCSGLQSSTCRHIVCQVWLSFGTATRTESLRVCPGCCLKMLFFRLVVSGCFSSSFDAGRIGRPAFFVRVAISFIRLEAFTRKSPFFEKERTEPFPTPKFTLSFNYCPIFLKPRHIYSKIRSRWSETWEKRYVHYVKIPDFPGGLIIAAFRFIK